MPSIYVTGYCVRKLTYTQRTTDCCTRTTNASVTKPPVNRIWGTAKWYECDHITRLTELQLQAVTHSTNICTFGLDLTTFILLILGINILCPLSVYWSSARMDEALWMSKVVDTGIICSAHIILQLL